METTDTVLTPAIRHAGHQMTEAQARAKMQSYIDERRGNAVNVLQKIQTVVPTNHVVPAGLIDFRANDDQPRVDYLAPGIGRESLHRNAIQQLAGRLEIPVAYIDHLMAAKTEDTEGNIVDRWGSKLLAQTLRQHTIHSPDRFLIRSVGGEARAVLSDKFRMIDCRPGALALLETARAKEMVVSDGTFTDTRSSLKFIMPKLFEVFPGEWMVFGFDWSNSDYGRGASDLRMFFWRAWCWNGAVGESVVRQIHIGRRLTDDVEYKADTLAADAKASALALRDAAESAMSETKVQRMIEGIRQAAEIKIDPKTRVESLKKIMTKGETEKVVQAFVSPDVENMPAGNSLWRWSNAISWVGGNLEDADRRIDFERIAGDVIKPAMPKAPEPIKTAA